MKNGAVVGLVVVSLLLWASTAPSATTPGNTRLDDIIQALLGVPPKTTTSPTTASGTNPVLLPTTGIKQSSGFTVPGRSVLLSPDASGGLFGNRN